ncbi:MAG: PQQ-binding-like beta-propeller repeat protein [Acidobacteriota bacterium]
MRRLTLLICLATFAFVLPTLASESNDHWPTWRGPAGTGEAPGSPPTEWSEEKNVAFKVDLPGLGSSTPVIWGDRLFLTVAIDTGKTPDGSPGEQDRAGRAPDNVHDWVVLAYSTEDGSEVWRSKVGAGVPHEGSHMDSTWASNSPVTDGERLYAYFGSTGLFALDLDGKVLWERDFGQMTTRMAFGEGSSPAVYGGTLVIQWDHEGESFIEALDAATGETKWQNARDEATSWSTPIIIEVDGRPQIITNATTNVRGYDLETGHDIWTTTGMTENVIPSPVHKDGMVYVMSGFRGYALQAINVVGAEGDLTGTDKVVWTYDKDTPYVASPLLYNGNLYFFKVITNIFTALDASNGELLYNERLSDLANAYASPVGAGGRVYLIGRKGKSMVLDAGKELEVLATNTLDDRFDASPVVLGDRLYLRGRESLYCIAE